MKKINPNLKENEILISLVIPVLYSQFYVFIELLKKLKDNVNYVFEIIAIVNHSCEKISSKDLVELDNITKGKIRIIQCRNHYSLVHLEILGLKRLKETILLF